MRHSKRSIAIKMLNELSDILYSIELTQRSTWKNVLAIGRVVYFMLENEIKDADEKEVKQ